MSHILFFPGDIRTVVSLSSVRHKLKPYLFSEANSPLLSGLSGVSLLYLWILICCTLALAPEPQSLSLNGN